MIVLVGLLAIITAATILAGGDPRALRHLGLRGEGVILLLFAVQALARGRLLSPLSVSLGWNPVFPWLVVTAALMAMVLWNLQQKGMPLVLAGLGANFLVVALNGGMPVSRIATASLLDGRLNQLMRFYELAESRTLVPYLGDVISAPTFASGARGILISAGDLLLLVGVSVLILSVMLPIGQLPVHNRTDPR